MNKTGRKSITILFAVIILAVVAVFAWFVMGVFEGETPGIEVKPLPAFLSGKQSLTVQAVDRKRGLRSLRITIDQSGRETVVLDRSFPYQGLFNKEGARRHVETVELDPGALGLAQGRAELQVVVFDHSRRGGGDGNRALLNHTMTVDTLPPSARALTRLHYVNQGGAGMVLYQTSSDTTKSGVLVGPLFFPGYPAREDDESGVHACYFAVPHDADPDTRIFLWAEDRAGNEIRTSFHHRIRRKSFREDRMNITDAFLERILPVFPQVSPGPNDGPVEQYLKINNELRRENHRTLEGLQDASSPRRLWEGPWVRLPNAATMARYADHRIYVYNGESIDEKDHMGVDLASLANSPVPAANHGRVVFAEDLGIYGQTVVLDHGQRVMSLYGHLSSIQVPQGQEVRKGDIIGTTGATGLAGGDHLHFSIMVNGVPVNPIEWWDPHWIRDHVDKKMATMGNP